MPAVIKFVTKFKSAEGRGWEEIHFRQSDSDNPNLKDQLNNYLGNVAPARALLLGRNCAIVDVTCSYPRVGAIASYGLRQYLPGNGQQASSDWASSLAVEFVDSTFTRRKITHLRGWWDGIVEDEEYHPERAAAAGWTERFTEWKEALRLAGYGWMSKDAGASRKAPGVTYVVNPADNTVTFTIPAPGIVVDEDHRYQEVRFSKFNNSKSVLNDQLLVYVATPTSLVTVNQIGAGPMLTKGRYNWRQTSFVGYSNTGSISTGERRMGRPLDRYPGRSKARPRI